MCVCVLMAGVEGEVTDDCSAAVSQADQEMGPINLYDIYEEACLGLGRDSRHFGNGGLSIARRCVVGEVRKSLSFSSQDWSAEPPYSRPMH